MAISLADKARQRSRTHNNLGIVDFCQSPRGLNQKLLPAQILFLKIFEREALNDYDQTIPIMDKFNENVLELLSETEYYERLMDAGRISMPYDVYCSTNTMHLILCMGRRASKTTLITSFIGYKLYQLLNVDFPQNYFGIIPTDPIKITSTAVSGDNATSLFKRMSSLLRQSQYFQPFLLEDPTTTSLKLWTRHDLEFLTPGKPPPTGSNSFTIAAVANSPGVRGDNNVIVVFDEFAHTERVKQLSLGAKALDLEMYEALVPSIAGFRNPTEEQCIERGVELIKGERYGAPFGKALFLSSPNGTVGKFYDDFSTAFQKGPDSYTLAIQSPTWEVNPSIAPEILHSEYNKSPVSYDQEFGGKFTTPGMNWLRDLPLFYSSIDKRLDAYCPHGRRDRLYFLGADLGLRNDGASVTISHYEPYYDETIESFSDKALAYWRDPRFSVNPEFNIEDGHDEDWYRLDNPEYLEALCRPKGRYVIDYSEVRYAGKPPYETLSVMDHESVIEWIKQLFQNWPIKCGVFDQWAGDLWQQLFDKAGIGKRFEEVVFNQQSNDACYKLFSSLLHEGALKIPDDPTLHDELLALKVEDKGRGIIKVEVPQNRGHDDRFDSIIRSLYLAHAHQNKNLYLAGGELKKLFNNIDPVQGGINLNNISNSKYREKLKETMHQTQFNIRNPNFSMNSIKTMRQGYRGGR